jgi:hypothetical protein
MRAVAISICLGLGLGVAPGCGEAASGPTSLPAFAPEPDQVLTSTSGALVVAVRFAPRPPIVGTNAVELSIMDASGAPVAGLAVGVVPWMPAHGHGTSVTPTITETAPGRFEATPLVLFMPGSWELRITTDGTVDDTAKAAFEIR